MKKRLRDLTILIVGICLGLALSVLAYSYLAQEVGFTPEEDDWDVENTKEALDYLYGEIGTYSDYINHDWRYGPSGDVVEFVAPYFGHYKIEAWGASGGDASDSYNGGYGGYSVGIVELNRFDKLYVVVGGSGSTSGNGGYNGGGRSSIQSGGYIGSAGGGATHIATQLIGTGLLFEYASNTDKLLIVAGGGGGSASGSGNTNGTGGSGGGTSGGSGTGSNNTDRKPGTGGTQLEAGTSGSTSYSSFTAPTFGVGCNASSSYGSYMRVSGGGGFYGGGCGIHSGGGGGSGYIGNSGLHDAVMYCYGCTESSEPATKTISTTGSNKDSVNCPDGYSSIAVSNCAKSGSGAVKIIYLGKN